MATSTEKYRDPSDFAPTTEGEIVEAIHACPIPQYRGQPKTAHSRLINANASLLSGLRMHVMLGRKQGGFLTAAIEDAFTRAVGRADNTTLTVLDAISTYLRSYPPVDAWGSETARIDWQDGDGLVGRRTPQEAWEVFVRRTM